MADELTVSLGYRYRSRLVIDPPASDRLAQHPSTLSGEPGTRAPHLWIRRKGRRRSLLAPVRAGLHIARRSAGSCWIDAAAGQGPRTPLLAYQIDADVSVETSWTDAIRLRSGATRCWSARTGFVAWRTTDAAPADLPDVLDHLQCARAEAATFTGGPT